MLMKRSCLIFALIVGLIELAVGADKPVDLTFGQLLSQRARLDHKRVSVIGYFDAHEVVLRAKQRSDDVIAIDLAEAQVLALKKKDLFRSGYVRVVGKFEFAGLPELIGPKDGRILYRSHAGFRGGFLMQISKITEFTNVPALKH